MFRFVGIGGGLKGCETGIIDLNFKIKYLKKKSLVRMADTTVQPKISFLTDRPRSTWNTAVQYVDFCIENPHKIMANGEKFTTNQMEFDTNPKHNKIFLSAHANKQESVAGETAGIYVNQVIIQLF